MNHLKKENLSSQLFFRKNYNPKNNFLENYLTKVCNKKIFSKKSGVDLASIIKVIMLGWERVTEKRECVAEGNVAEMSLFFATCEA